MGEGVQGRRGSAGPWLVLIFLLAASLRVSHLGVESVWLDEATSVDIARDPPVDVILDATRDVHPPLYYLALHVWMRMTGDSEPAVRGLSVLFSLLAIAALVAFATRWFDRPTALVAALLAAISPLQIAFAQEARMYALLTLTAVLSIDAFLCVLRHGTRRALAGYVAATSAMLYTHAYAGFVVAGQGLWLAGALVVATRHRSQWWRRGLLAFGLTALVFLPWVPSFLAQLYSVERTFWISGQTRLASAVVAQAGSAVLAWMLGPLAAGAVAVSVVRSRRQEGSMAAATLCAAIIACVIGLPFGLSRVSTPVFLPKYTIAASLAFVTLAARGLVLLPARRLCGAALIGIVALTVVPLRAYFTTRHKDDWRDVVAQVERAAEPGDLVVFSQAFGVEPFHYYAHRTDLVELPFLDTSEGLTTRSVNVLAGVAVAPYDRVWVVLSDPDATTDAVIRNLRAYREAIDDSGGGVEARLFVRRGAPPRTP
jgi:4-amino-4-deoxy-L-arabinose transferase-like glycosyltransferase